MIFESSAPGSDHAADVSTGAAHHGMDDGVHYPVSDDMGESGLQISVVLLLITLLEDYFATLDRPVLVGGNQFFYFKRGDPGASVAPDLYIIEDETLPRSAVLSWKVWEHDGKVPSFVLEVVSDEHQKDYAERALTRYEQLGVREFVRYDPGHAGRPSRHLLSHFLRDDAGRLVPQPVERGRVHCRTHDFWLIPQTDRTLRIGCGPGGAALWPTPAERTVAADAARKAAEARAAADNRRAELADARATLESQRAAAESERAAAEAERAAAEAERAAAAEAELARLQLELARLRDAGT